MMAWWGELSEPSKVAIATGAFSLIINVVVVAIGFAVTYFTAIASNKSIARHASEVAALQIEAANSQKMADFRIRWIEDLRRSTSSLYKAQYELSLVVRDLQKAPKSPLAARKVLVERRRELNLEVAELKRDIGLRINPETTDANEIRLRELLNRSVSRDVDKAKTLRKEIEQVVGQVIRTEWRKVRDSLGGKVATLTSNVKGSKK